MGLGEESPAAQHPQGWKGEEVSFPQLHQSRGRCGPSTSKPCRDVPPHPRPRGARQPLPASPTDSSLPGKVSPSAASSPPWQPSCSLPPSMAPMRASRAGAAPAMCPASSRRLGAHPGPGRCRRAGGTAGSWGCSREQGGGWEGAGLGEKHPPFPVSSSQPPLPERGTEPPQLWSAWGEL